VRASFTTDIPAVFVPDFRSNAIERKYSQVLGGLQAIIEEKTERGRLGNNLRRILAVQNIQMDEVLTVMQQVADTYDAGEHGHQHLWEKAQAYLNEILLEISWGEVLSLYSRVHRI
jgi:hypothetical protein